jgi:molybdopterin-binding protein
MIDVLSPCVTFNDHEGSTKSYSYVKDHEEPLGSINFVPYFDDINIDYDAGTTTTVTLHNGSKLLLTKIAEDYEPTDKHRALSVLRDTSRRGEYATGILYVEPDKQDFIELLGLVDEPLASLDAQRKVEILRYIELLRDDVRIPIVYVSHAVDEVLRLADWVVLLSKGSVTAAGGVQDIMGHAELASAGGPFQGGTVIEAKVVAQDMEDELATVAFDGGALTVSSLDALIGEPVRVRVRARDVSLALEEPRAISVQNVLRGTVSAVGEPQQGVVQVSVAVGAVTLRSRVTRRAAAQLGLAPGVNVYALVKAVSLDRQRDHDA